MQSRYKSHSCNQKRNTICMHDNMATAAAALPPLFRAFGAQTITMMGATRPPSRSTSGSGSSPWGLFTYDVHTEGRIRGVWTKSRLRECDSEKGEGLKIPKKLLTSYVNGSLRLCFGSDLARMRTKLPLRRNQRRRRGRPSLPACFRDLSALLGNNEMAMLKSYFAIRFLC